MPPVTVVFDVETDRLLDASRSNWSELVITVAVFAVLRRPSAEPEATRSFVLPPRGGPEIAALLDGADAIVAYNGRHFDLRVLRNLYDAARVDGWEAKLMDPFEVIRATTRSWVKLNELLEANGLPVKAGDGRSAVDWWAAGEVEKVTEYCRLDVLLLCRLLVQETPIVFPIKEWQNQNQAQTPARDPSRNSWTHAVVGWAELDWPLFVSRRWCTWSTRHSGCLKPKP